MIATKFDPRVIEFMTPAERKELDGLIAMLPVWEPDERNRPQCAAFETEAFETLYGGAAGGGKSDLLLGMARTAHARSLLLRREFPDLERSLISRSMEFYGDKRDYNGSKHVWSTDGRRIEFGHMERVGTPQIPGDESQYASAPYDLIGIDQLEQFPRYAYEFMFSRARSANKNQRVQIVSSANPVGQNIEWIMQRWRAWLITSEAKSGEIRWYKRDEAGNDVETTADDPDALSRTFIAAGLKDNPYLGDDYRRTLASLPIELRKALLDGDWSAMLTDDAYQVIPRAWVKAAMARWVEKWPDDSPLVLGVDIARGGDDWSVIAPKRGRWFGRPVKKSGRETDTGAKIAKMVIEYLEPLHEMERVYQDGKPKEITYNDGNFVLPIIKSKVVANMDVIGVGASGYDTSRTHGINAKPINFGAGSDATDKSGTLFFFNERARDYWSLRELLDPESGISVMLPPDLELEADLCAARWSMQGNKIKIEPKEDIKKRIGRSPDEGDAVVLANVSTPPIQVFF